MQTSQRKRSLPLDWDEDLARLAGDRSLSTDHKVRVGVHQGNELVLFARDGDLICLLLGWQLLYRTQYRECVLLMEKILVVATRECPHQADCAHAHEAGKEEDPKWNQL
jgi:hypothetical protein